MAPGDVVTVTRIDGCRAAPGTCSPSSSASWTRRRNSGTGGTVGRTGRARGSMMAVLGGLADVERNLIRTRTAEGRSRARLKGSTWAGRLTSHRQQQKEARQTARAGRYVAGIGRQLRPQHRHHAPRHARRLSCTGDAGISMSNQSDRRTAHRSAARSGHRRLPDRLF